MIFNICKKLDITGIQLDLKISLDDLSENNESFGNVRLFIFKEFE